MNTQHSLNTEQKTELLQASYFDVEQENKIRRSEPYLTYGERELGAVAAAMRKRRSL